MNGDWTPQAVHAALSSAQAVLIDVREPMEFAAERNHGALNMPLSTFEPAGLPLLSSQTLIFACGSGKRSRTALDILAATRPLPAAHLAGGIAAWKAAGYPTIRIDPATGLVLDPH
jgi:rhodanese-related sulfurtransferase